MKKKISPSGTFWDFSPGLWVGVFETRYLGEFMGDLGRIYIGRKRRLRAFFLSWLFFACVLLPATMPIDSFCRYRRRCQKKKYILPKKKNEKKGLFVFFGLYAPENLATPQSTLQIVRENGRRGGWLPSSIHRATPGLQGGGRSGWTVQASAVGRSCRDRWRSLLSSQRYVAPPRHAGSKDRVSVKRLAPKP